MNLLVKGYLTKAFEFACEEKPEVSRELLDSLELLKWNVSPRSVVGFSRICAVATLIFFLIIGMLFFSSDLVLVFLISAVGFASVLHYVSEYPKIAAKEKLIRAIGDAPRTLVYLIVPLKQNPNLEEAFRFAAEHGEGEIASDLKTTLWNSWSGKIPSVKGKIPEIAEKWGKFAPEFRHSLYLIVSALSEKSAGSRALTLERALSYSLEGIVSKMQAYVSALFVPTLLIFSFGTIVPLMFVSLLPLLVYFGVRFSSPFEIAALLAVTLLVLFVYSEKILLQRPPAFSQPRFDLVKLPLPAWFIITVATLVIGFPGLLFFLSEANLFSINVNSPLGWLVYNVNTLSLLWGFALGVSLCYYLQAAPLKKLKSEQRQVESELVSVLHQLASRLAEKRPPEEAMEFTASASPNSALAQVLGQASLTIKKRSATLESALFDEKFGAARNIPSRTVETALQLFKASCKKGSVACSQILYSASDYFARLYKVEEELRSLLSKNISMLRATAIVFAPVVTGIVVVMFGLISKSMADAQSQLAALGYEGGFSSALLLQLPTFSTPVLLLIVGAYMLGLCLVTMRYSCFVENGPDQVEYKLETAKALPLSMAVFTIVVIFASSFLATG